MKTEITYPSLPTWGLIAFSLNWTIESGKGDITFQEVYDNIEGGDMLEFLDKRFPGAFDWSLFKKGSEERKAILEVYNMIAGGLKGRENRKVGINRSGLHLLLAFTIEAMQQKFWSVKYQFKNGK